jgi:hypothetical protein
VSSADLLLLGAQATLLALACYVLSWRELFQVVCVGLLAAALLVGAAVAINDSLGVARVGTIDPATGLARPGSPESY